MKQKFYLTILNLLKEGKNPAKISKELGISKQKLNYYIGKLKKVDLIQKKGYGTWEVKEVKSSLSIPRVLGKKEIRGHAYIWRVKVPKEIKEFNLNHMEHKLVGRAKYPRIIIKGKKVWLGKKHIIVFEHNSFYGRNSLEARKYAVLSLLEVLRALELKLGINLKPYVFKPSKEHYGMIKNDLARQYNKNGDKLVIRDNLEGEWLWIDDSESLGELETKNIVRSKQVQDWWNDNKKHNFEVSPTFILNTMNQFMQTQGAFDRNIVKHQNVLEEMSKTLKMIQESLNNAKKMS